MSAILLQLACDQLVPDPTQPRTAFGKEALEQLAASLKARGLLQPLRVMEDAERGCYVIICGESRWRAAKLAGMTHVPCLVVETPPSEADMLADRIVENQVRQDLRPLEFARALSRLKMLKGCNSRSLATELGLNGAAITRAESLLTLPDDIQNLVDIGVIAGSAAYELSRLPDVECQRTLADAITAGRMNRDQVAEAVRARIGRKKTTPKASRLACRLDGGLSVTLSSVQPLGWAELLAGLDRLRREAKKLSESGQDVATLARVLRAV